MSSLLPVQVDRGVGRPLVLLHGLGNNFRSWTYVLDRLDESRNRVIALDLLGFGDAPKPDVDYTLDDHAEAVIATLDDLGVDDAVIAGHSMGCLVAARVASRRPDLASRLVLLGAPVFETIPAKPGKVRRWSQLLSGIRTREGLYARAFHLISDEPELTIAAAESTRYVAPLLKGMEITDETWRAFKRSLTHTIVQTESYDDLRRLSTPGQLVDGLFDVFVMSDTLRELARANPSLTYRTALGPHEITPLGGRVACRILQNDKTRAGWRGSIRRVLRRVARGRG